RQVCPRRRLRSEPLGRAGGLRRAPQGARRARARGRRAARPSRGGAARRGQRRRHQARARGARRPGCDWRPRRRQRNPPGRAGGRNEPAKAVMMAQPEQHAVLLPSLAAWLLVGLGVAVVLIATAGIVRKRATILAKWAGASGAPSSAAPTS